MIRLMQKEYALYRENHLELPIWKASSEAVIKIYHRERARVKMRTNLMATRLFINEAYKIR
jgi:hypothetical protein